MWSTHHLSMERFPDHRISNGVAGVGMDAKISQRLVRSTRMLQAECCRFGDHLAAVPVSGLIRFIINNLRIRFWQNLQQNQNTSRIRLRCFFYFTLTYFILLTLERRQ